MDYKKLSRITDAPAQVKDLLSEKDVGAILTSLKKRFPEIAERLDAEFTDILREAFFTVRKESIEKKDKRTQELSLLREAYPDAYYVNFYSGVFTVQAVAETEEDCKEQIEEWTTRIPEGFKRVHANKVKVISNNPGYRGYLEFKSV